MIKILPYKQGSRSAKALATALGCKVLRLQNSSYRPKPHDVIINWGFGRSLAQLNLDSVFAVLNPPYHVSRAVNKLTFFENIKETNPELIPDFWTNKEDIPEEAFPVLARQSLTGHSGAGIRWCDSPSDCVDAPLYVKYVKKSEEYRVHISDRGGVFLVQRKARRLDHDNPDWRIRNHANGFIYQREDFVAPLCVLSAAEIALDAAGLHFGAVDVIYNKHYDKSYVLEINTAPGLDGSTTDDYANMFIRDYFT